MKEKIEEIRTAVANANLKKGLKELKDLIEEFDFVHHRNTIDSLSARYTRLLGEIHKGTISDSDKNLEMNKITDSVLSLLDQVEEEEDQPPSGSFKQPKSSASYLVTIEPEPFFQVSMDAVALMEFRKMVISISEAIAKRNWKMVDRWMDRLSVFDDVDSVKVKEEILSYLSSLSSLTINTQIPLSFIFNIVWEVIKFYPIRYRDEYQHLAHLALNAGTRIAYDGMRSRKNLVIVANGLLILKAVYRSVRQEEASQAERKTSKEFQDEHFYSPREEVMERYAELEELIERLTELQDELRRLLRAMKVDLENSNLSYPLFDPDLMERFESDQHRGK